MNEAEELAQEHWNWLCKYITRIPLLDKDDIIEILANLYIDAFIHGYKHGQEKKK